MDLLRRIESSVWPLTVESGAGITDQFNLKAQIAGHAARCGNAMVCGQSAYHQVVYVLVAQPPLQIRPNKTAIDVFDQQRLVVLGLETRNDLPARLFFPQQAVRVLAVVNTMKNRLLGFAPMIQKGPAIVLGVWVIAIATPISMILKSLLPVNEEEGFTGHVSPLKSIKYLFKLNIAV